MIGIKALKVHGDMLQIEFRHLLLPHPEFREVFVIGFLYQQDSNRIRMEM